MPNNQINLFPDAELPALRPGADGSPICRCHHCDETIHASDAIDFQLEPHCNECIVECEHCNTQSLADDGELEETNIRRRASEMRCDSCRFQCADCNEWFAEESDEYRNDEFRRVCEACSENYTNCDECNICIEIDNSSYDEDNGRTLCHDCYHNQETEDDCSIHPHDYKPLPCFKHEDNADSHAPRSADTLYYGVEVEVEGDKNAAERVNGDLFYCKHDGSLDDGFEIVSHPATLSCWRGKELKVFDNLRRDGWRSYDTNTCGMHVHVSRSALTELDILKLLRFFRDAPDFVHFVSRRRTSEAMKRWAKIDNRNQAWLLRKAKRRYIRDEGENGHGGTRYAAINTCPRDTVEFRIFRGTLKVSSFKRNLELVDSLIAFVKCHCLYRLTAPLFVNFVGKQLNDGDTNKLALREWIMKFQSKCLVDAGFQEE